MDFDKSKEILKVDFECSACNKIKKDSMRIPVRRIIEKLDSFFDKNDLSGARTLLEYWKKEAENIKDFSGELSIVNEMLGLYRKTSEKEKAENAVKRAIELLNITGSEDSIQGATIIINAATTQKAFGNPEKAAPLYEKAEKIYKKNNIQDDDLRYAAFYNNYATTLTDLKEFERAESLYKKAISLTAKNIGSLPDCAVSYVNLAHLYDEWKGSLSEYIEICMNKAEEILYDENILRNSYYAFVCEKCAPGFDYFGYFKVAEELKDIAREIYERA